MSRSDQFIKFPLAAALLAAMGSAAPGHEPVGEAGALIAREQVPAPALATITTLAGGPDFGPVTVAEEAGERVFAADMTIDGHAAGVKVDQSGTLLCVTTELAAWELPTQVKRTAEVETLGFPARSIVARDEGGVRTYVVDAATPMRGKRLEIDAGGVVIHKELRLG